MKKITMILSILFLIIINGFTGCGITEQEPEGSLILQLEKDSFTPLDTLKGSLTFTNLTANTIAYQFGTSCQFGLKIMQGDQIFLEYPGICLQVLTSLTLKSGEAKRYEFHLPLIDINNNFLNHGEYTIKAYLLTKNSPRVIKLISVK